jgi:ribosome recycling factor
MIEEIKDDARERMHKTAEVLGSTFNKIRTGRAHPSLLDAVKVEYYGNEVPLSQAASISVSDARTLAITPWEKNLVPEIEKAIMKSDLGLNPSTAGQVIRITMPPLTEETRKDFIRQARHEAEQARVSVRNIRRDAMTHVKQLLKDKELSEDDEHRAEGEIQKITDEAIAAIDEQLAAKEKDLLEI